MASAEQRHKCSNMHLDGIYLFLLLYSALGRGIVIGQLDVVHRSRVRAIGVGSGSDGSTLSARHTSAIQSLLLRF
jgi:hypothetical protein